MEQTLVITAEFGALSIALAEVGFEVDILADQDPVVLGQPHRNAGKGIGGCQAPIVHTAQGLTLGRCQPPRETGIGGEDQELALKEAELLGEAVDPR